MRRKTFGQIGIGLAIVILAAVTLHPQSLITAGPGNPTTYLVPGTSFATNSVALIDSLGRIGSVQGTSLNCVLVNGTSGPCGFTGSILPSNILGVGASVGQVLAFNGSAYAPTNPTGGGGGGTLSAYLNSTLIGTRPSWNLLAGAGSQLAMTDTGTQINVQIQADTSYVASVAAVQAGALSYVPAASASGTTYAACPASVVASLSTGMVLNFVPDANSTGGATTLNLCTIGAKSLFLANGSSNPSSSSLKAGQMYTVWFDGTNFRLKDVTS